MTRQQGLLVAIAAALGALSNFVCLFLARRALPDVAHYDEFLVFWSLLFGLFGVLSGVQNETTRAIAAVDQGREPGTRAVWPALLTGAGLAVLTALLWPVLGRVLPTSAGTGGLVMVVAGVAYVLYVTMTGAVGGRGLWGEYAALLSSETVLRMVLMGVLALVGTSLGGLEWAVLLATVGWLVALLLPRPRAAFLGRADGTLPVALRRTLLAVFSTSCTAILVTAYPAIMKGTGSAGDAALSAALILAVSLCRAPIMMPLTSFQGVAIKAFLAHRERPLAAVAKPAAILFGLGAVGAAGAWLVGPPFVRIVFGVADVPGWVYAALTFSSAFLALLTLLGALALAVDRHGLYALGWLLASAVTIGVLVVVPDPTLRVVASLFLGPALGCVPFLVGLRVRPAQPILEPSSR